MKMNKLFFPFAISFVATVIACSSDSGNSEKEKTIADTVNPTIICVADMNVNIEATANAAIVTYSTPAGIDNLPGAVTTQTAGLASGATFQVGVTTNTFQVKDAAGNAVSCSFKVTVVKNAPSADLPYFVDVNPTPTDKKWTKVENMSDEFSGSTLDNTKWINDPSNDGFKWIGRAPGLFEPSNVTVSDGNLNVTTRKRSSPEVINGNTYTHGGAIVRSKNPGNLGMYYECRMKANKTVMSSTFWLAMKNNCPTVTRKLELDIQECVGKTNSGTASWATKYTNIFHSNAFRHAIGCDTGITQTQQIQGAVNLSEKNTDRFFVYACWWKSATELVFYLDGKYAYTITPPTNYDIDGFITMAIEVYDWNPIDPADTIWETGSFDDLTTKYDWVRTWKLADK
ncbi:HYR domain-containing protein [Flavobacterium ovatum]|uniref:HYR domain-containing protein n=1 Tax=Flavobacterium ovatum TaxID=1928857 RepID=UPI00344CE858